jgi:PAS domain S-box-containing protein
MKDKAPHSKSEFLRQKAEEILTDKPIIVDTLCLQGETLKLLHELDVHQIELEMQNEELKLLKDQIEIAAEKYIDLYDFAPSGYFTLSKNGEIHEINFKGANMLGKERSLLLNNRFAFFLTNESKSIFSSFLDRTFESKIKESCEIALSVNPDTPTYLLLNATTVEDREKCFITAVDISVRKAVEKELRENEEKYHTLFDSNRDSITIFRLDSEGIAGNFIEANTAATEIYGYTKEELLSMNARDLEPISQKIRKQRNETLLANGKLDLETIIKTKKGKFRNVEIKSLIINYLNEPGVMTITRDITERKQIETNAKKAQENLVTILDAIPDLLFEVGIDGRIHYYHAHYFDLLAVPPEVFMGKLFQDVLPADVATICMEAIQEAAEKGWSTGKQYAIDLDKGKRWFELAVSPIKENDSKDKHFILLARDITERKKSIEALQESEEKLSTIFNVANSGIVMTNINGKFINFNDMWTKMLGYTREEMNRMSLFDIIHPDGVENAKKAISEISVSTKEIPIYERLYIKKDKSILWGEVSLSAIKNVDNTYNIVAVVTDITNRKKAENALVENKQNLQSIFDSVSEAIYIMDETGTFIDVNKGAQKMYQYSKQELIGKSPQTIAAPGLNDLDKITKKLQKVLETGNPTQFEFWAARKNGEFFPKEVVVNKGKYFGKDVLITTARDITDRKKAEEMLQKSQEKLRGIFELANSGIILTDVKGKYLLFNNWCTKNFGYTREEMNKLSSKDLTHPDDYIKAEILFNKIIEGKTDRYQLEKRFVRKDKSFFWGEISVSAIKDNNGKTVNTIGIINDISERKQAQAKLITNENFLKQTQIIANLGSYSLDFTTGKWTSTAILDSIFGIDPDFERTTTGWESILHPEWKTIVHDYLNNEVIDKGVNFNKEYKIIKVDSKEERWVHGMGEITFDKEGQPLQLIGSIQDITERKLNEEKLKLSLEKFQDLVNSTGGIVWEADALTFDFTYVSKQAERLLGFPAEEWYTKGFWANHIHPEDKEKAVEFCASFTKLMKSHDFVYRFIAKNGKIVWLRDIVNVIVEEGKPRWLRGVMFDITSQKENEESLSESEEKYRGLVENSPDAVVIYVDGIIVFTNQEGIRMVGAKTREEVIGKPVLQFIHPDSLESIIKRMEEVILDNNSSETVEEKFINLDGKPIDVEIKAIPTYFEHKPAVQVIIHDISRRKQSTFELNKINRVYSLISQINNLILRSKNREELLQEICSIAVTYGKFRMSWIGILDDDGKTVNTAAFSGVEEGFFKNENEILILEEPRGNGPTGTAMREGRTVICNNIATDTIMERWRDRAKELGYRSSISIPIVVLDKIIGSFNLYSEDTNSFSLEEEVELLEKITQNIAFTLESIIFEEDRIKTQEKIKQLSQAVEQSPVTIVITNTKGEIEYVNPKFSETTGYSFDEAVGQNPRMLKSGQTSAAEYKELWQTLAAGNEWHGEFHNIRKDGESYWESASISPILNVQGKTTHYIAIKEDITARKNAENELIKAKEKAEESDRLKLAFLANMSHEIRTPMNGILGFTELLKAPHLSGEEQQEYIEIIEKSGKRMLNIINDIISISKVESGQIEISLSETNVNEQIHYINTFFKPEAKQKGIQLNIAKELASKDTFIKTDREKLYAILTNLVKNAIKFTNGGSIEFGCEKKQGMLEFFVKDTGLGISNSQKKIIFERFRQANETISRSHEGSGLGLAISKAYVEMLGGKIWVKSEEGKGSTFYFTIPFQSEYKPEEKNGIEKPNSGIKAENKIKDLKVLIVEDDAISKLLVTIAVKPFSKDILKVSTGFEAIEACRNNPDIDLVMMDINMPEMGGYEATKQIREFNKDLVIIAQTANGMQSDREDAIAAGCTDYISKPVNIASLGELINKYFKK